MSGFSSTRPQRETGGTALKAAQQGQPTDSQADKPTRRMIFAYQSASAIALAISLFWTVAFAREGLWLLSASEIILATVSLASWLLIRAGRFTAALIITEIAFLTFILTFSLMFDTPTPDAPRVSHLYLPVLAMLAYINYLRRRSVFQLGFIAVALLCYIVFTSGVPALPFAQPIPDELRPAGVWANSIISTVMMVGAIYALQLEFARHKGMARDLRMALRNRELELFLQPQVDRAGALIGAEALLRWKHPQRGYIPPGVFIPVAEESGLMPLLGPWVLAESCRILGSWKADPALSSLSLAVNVSASQFAAEDFEEQVLGLAALHGADPARLKLELTESVIVSGLERVAGKMQTLRKSGIRFALDDFGTGYSALSYLQRLPVDEIKIDRSFVQEAPAGGNAASLVRSIVQIGLDLGHVMLAEGVETREQYTMLRACGCAEFQGYYFGRPVSRAAFEQSARGKPESLADIPA